MPTKAQREAAAKAAETSAGGFKPVDLVGPGGDSVTATTAEAETKYRFRGYLESEQAELEAPSDEEFAEAVDGVPATVGSAAGEQS